MQTLDSLMSNPKADIDLNGIAAIIVPIMIPKSKRVEEQTIRFLYELLLALSIVHPDFGWCAEKPKIIIVFNDLSNDEDSSDDNQSKKTNY